MLTDQKFSLAWNSTALSGLWRGAAKIFQLDCMQRYSLWAVIADVIDRTGMLCICTHL